MTTEIHITEDPPIVTIVQSGPIGPPGVAGGAGTDHDDLTNVTTSQHHVKYTDAESVTAMGVEGDANPLNHARVTDVEIDARAALQDHDHATPIAAHAADASAHHVKYTDAEAVTAVGPHFSGDAVDLGSGAEAATRMIEADGAGNMVFVDKPSGGGGSTLHEDLTDVTTSQHHVRYADSESVTAMGVKADSNALNHDRYTDAEADARAALQDHDHATPIAAHAGDTAAHHTKYLDAEAVSAMGVLGDTNPLNHDRFALADIPHDPFYNGTFTEPFDATVTSDGATVTMAIEQKGGGDLTERFTDGETVLDCTPAATIALTAGTDAAPQGNWVYILQSTKALTLSTTTWPTAVEHIKVGYFLVPTAGFVQTNGVMVNQNWNDPATGTDGQGHLSHITERARLDGAYYFSGLAGAGVDDYLTIVGTTVDLKIAAGVVFQMHRHASPAFDTSASDLVLVKNWSGDPFHDITNLYDIVADSGGTTIGNNRYFNIVLWGVANKTGEYEPVMINLPAGTYTSQADAENDVDGFDDFTIPREFALDSSTGFLIARLTVQKLASSWDYLSTTDLRGTTPQSASGGGAGGLSSPLTTKGDLWGYDTADNRLPVGTDDQVLTADAAETLGVKWATPSGGSGLPADSWLANMFSRPSTETAHADDDEFDDASLTGWTEVAAAGTGTPIWTEDAHVLSIQVTTKSNSQRHNAQVKPLTLAFGDYIETVVKLSSHESSVAAQIGLVFADGATPSAGAQAYGGFVQSWRQFRGAAYTNYEIEGVHTEFVWDAYLLGDRYWLRLYYVAANTFRLDWSQDGVTWVAGNNFTSTLVPTHGGVTILAWDNTWGAVTGTWDYFRRG